MEEYAFRIEYLIAPFVEERLDNSASIEEKLKILFALVDVMDNDNFYFGSSNSYFDEEETSRIVSFWNQKAEEVEGYIAAPSLSDEDREFILGYAKYFPDFKGIKDLISDLCSEDFRDEAVTSAQKKIDDKILRDKENKRVLIDDISFDDDGNLTSASKKKKTSLDEAFEFYEQINKRS